MTSSPLNGKGPDAISSQQPYSPHTFQPSYKSAHTRARIATVLLMVGGLLSLASLLVSLLELFVPSLATSGDEEITDPQVLVFALLQLGLGLMQVAVYVATIVAFLMWVYRSYENLPSFGVRRNTIKYTSGWAVGSFFVPFVSLVVPYRAMKELWNKSLPNSSEMFGDLGSPGVFPLWWTFWLASNFANQLYFRLSWQSTITTEVSATLGVVTSILDILAAILAIMVVKEIDKQQTETAKSIPREWMGMQPPPPPPSEPFLSQNQ